MERTQTEAEQYQEIKARLNQQLASFSRDRFSFSASRYPGVGTSGGFQFVLEDRSGKDVQFPGKQPQQVSGGGRKRPEIGMVSTTFLRACRKIGGGSGKGAETRCGHQRCLSEHSGFSWGVFINYYNDFGRTCRSM